MMKQSIMLFLAIIVAFQFQAQSQSQSQSANSPIIFIYDASGSMWGQIEGKSKMEIASDVLSEVIQKLPENQEVGLVVYGHRNEGDCEDVEFLFDPESGAKDQLIQALKRVKPLGKTPLAYSATLVIDKLRTSGKKATIILITDGIESCDGSICDVIAAAKSEGIDFRLHIVGFGLKNEETEQLKCAAKAGEGRYYDATDGRGLSDVLNEATAVTVDKPIDNFSVLAVKNGTPFDALIKAYSTGTRTLIQNARTYGDTAFLYISPGRYDLEVIPLENSKIEAIQVLDIESFSDRITHKTVSFDGGKIVVNTLNNGEGWDAVVKIYSKSSGKQVAGGRTYGRADEYELNPGIYDLSLQAMRLDGLDISTRIEDVEVKSNETTPVDHNFKSGIAMIGAKSDETLVDCVVKIVEISEKKNVANGRTYQSDSSNPRKFILNPGAYEVTLTALGKFAGKKKTFTMTVKENETTEKMIEL